MRLVQVDLPGLKGVPDPQVLRGPQGRLVELDLQVRAVLQVLQEVQVLVDLQDLKAQAELLAPLGRLVQQAQVLLVLRVPLGLVARRGVQEVQVHQDLQGLRVLVVVLDLLDLLDLVDLQVRQVAQDPVDPLDPKAVRE